MERKDSWNNDFYNANGNGNGNHRGGAEELEAGAPVSSQFRAGSTPQPNAQQALQGENGREAGTRKANPPPGFFRLAGDFFYALRKSDKDSRRSLQEPNTRVVGGQEGVGRAAGGRPGDYDVSYWAQEYKTRSKILEWLAKSEASKKNHEFQKDESNVPPARVLTNRGAINGFESSSRTSFGLNQVATEVGQAASSSEANVSATVPTTDPSAGGLAEHALYGMSPFSSPRTQG